MTITSLDCQVAHRRSGPLASAIAQFVHRDITTVAVMCCEAHRVDGAAARAAAGVLGAAVLDVPMDITPRGLRRLLAEADATVLLACDRGTEAWKASGSPVPVMGDAPGVLWWRIAELRAAPGTFAEREPVPTARSGRAPRRSERWTADGHGIPA